MSRNYLAEPRFGDVFRWDNQPYGYDFLVMYVCPGKSDGFIGIQLTENHRAPLTTFRPTVTDWGSLTRWLSSGARWVPWGDDDGS